MSLAIRDEFPNERKCAVPRHAVRNVCLDPARDEEEGVHTEVWCDLDGPSDHPNCLGTDGWVIGGRWDLPKRTGEHA